MIHYIKGVITETEPGMAVIEANGIGYEVYVPDNCPVLFSGRDELVTLFTYMAVREDDVSLYGFTDKESLNMFRLLTTVSGIGNKGAMAILSKLTVRELRQAIEKYVQDYNTVRPHQSLGNVTPEVMFQSCFQVAS